MVPEPDRPVIRVTGARQHNLKNIDVEIPRGSLTVITGLSGSGKSSLAFDTIFAEGQRKYVESLSPYARQFLEQMQKPDVDRIEGLSPTIAIEQRVTAPGPRSTVATTTEIHDFLRVLFARTGQPRCWICDRPIVRQTTAQIVDSVLTGHAGKRLLILAPLVSEQRGQHKAILERMQKEGFVRARVDGEVVLLEEMPSLAAARKHTIEVVVDRIQAKPEMQQRLADSVELATRLADGRLIVSVEADEAQWRDIAYSSALACAVHPEVRIEELSPTLFSFNSPEGACELCHGLGTALEFDPELVVPDPNLSLNEGAVAAWRHQGRKLNAIYRDMLAEFCAHTGVSPDIPFRNIPEATIKTLLHGSNDAVERGPGFQFEGVLPNLRRRWQTTGSESAKQRLHAFLSEAPCERCRGARLNERALCVKLGERSIADLSALSIDAARDFFNGLELSGEAAVVGGPVVAEVRRRLAFLCDVGVSYLDLNRASATLSGGEFQRIRLATQIGSQLSGVCYVLDEPTIGLHPRDTDRLRDLLTRLKGLDNTVIVVEHDEEIIRGADYLIDIGPGAGEAGGRVVAAGLLSELLRQDDRGSCQSPGVHARRTKGDRAEKPIPPAGGARADGGGRADESVTLRFLTGKTHITPPDERRQPDWQKSIELRGVTAHNLKNIDVRFPLKCLVAVTGVSGSGKSTLIHHVLHRVLRRRLHRAGPQPEAYQRIVGSGNVDEVVEIDQTPIGRTPRSNPATYVGVFNLIRELYSRTREAKVRGYNAARFSFNVKGGRCEQCEGQGVKRIAMHFLPDVYVQCAECRGARYNRETLQVRYRGKSIADVLDMPVDEAARFFENFHNISRRLQALKDVGLGYIKLGQGSSTLSGGEAQRVKLAAELHRPTDVHTLYLLDEPTTGLHFADVRNLLTLLNRLVDKGKTVIVIEHNLDVIKCADWVIDLGPEGGEAGGQIVAEGPPERIAGSSESHTGRYLAAELQRSGTPAEL
jgi:excinuclease ABC subunit A